jgi:uncharacterized integral membrane protein
MLRESTRYSLAMTGCTLMILLEPITLVQIGLSIMGIMFLLLALKELEQELKQTTEQADL